MLGPLLHAGAAGALVIVVLAVAYGVQAPVVGVAEFAPAARQEVAAPPTTRDPEGGGPGSQGRRSDRVTTTTVAPVSASTGLDGQAQAPTTRVGRGRPCYGNPPRQLPDPRAPLCVPTIYEGDNGGATSTGVTSTEVRIAVNGNGTEHITGVTALFEYMNRHFEFYGRQLKPVFLPHPGASDPATHRAYANDVAALGVFGAMPRATNASWSASYYQGLARNHVVTVVEGTDTPVSDKELADPLHPFLWTVNHSVEQRQRNQAAFICAALAGRPPSHAPEMPQTKPRSFGIMSVGNVLMPKTHALIDGLGECGVSPAATAEVDCTANSCPTAFRLALQRLQDAGVTTLICSCWDALGLSVVREAGNMGWLPEVVAPFNNLVSLDEDYVQRITSAPLRERVFGLQPFPKVLPRQAQFWFSAVLESRPAALHSEGYYLVDDYDQLLVLASGIQAAGPILTPDTFAQGLMSGAFPNSEAGQAPYYSPSVGFGPGDHSFYNDFALVWWSEEAEGHGPRLVRPQGSWCYLDRGARFAAGSFPTNADGRFFSSSEPCR